MFKRLAHVVCLIFVLSSIITKTLGASGEGLLGRLTAADLVGVVALLLASLTLLKRAILPKAFPHFMMLVVALGVGGLLSVNTQLVVVEVLILLYLGLVYYALVNLNATRAYLTNMIVAVAVALIASSALSAWVMWGGGARISTEYEMTAAVGGFRTTGQAGAFALVALTILVPARVSKLYHANFSAWQRLVVNIGVCAGVMFLIATVKIAAWIGFGIGMGAYAASALSRRQARQVVYAVMLVVVVVAGFFLLTAENAQWGQSMESKVTRRSDAVQSDDSFIYRNLTSAVLAFQERPLVGTGLGAFAGSYATHEVHSTYFKMLGETGLIGLGCYVVFMFVLVSDIKRSSRLTGVYGDYLRGVYPFVIGCMVSWTYTFHLRKREFWILAAIVYIAGYLARKEAKPTQGKMDRRSVSIRRRWAMKRPFAWKADYGLTATRNPWPRLTK